MNAKIIITSLFLLIVQISFAQKGPIITYEWLEEKSKIISELQQNVNGTKLEGEDVIFREENFKVFYTDKLASYSATLIKKDGTELLLLVEDLDFSKAISIREVENQVIVLFPENTIKLQVYGNGQSTIVNINSNTVDFYTNSDTDRKKMFTTLYDLIIFLKADKGIMTTSDGYRDLHKYKTLKPYEFYQKYPKSVLAYEGKLLEADYERQVRFVNSFVKRYGIPVLGNSATTIPYSDEVMNYPDKHQVGVFSIPLKRAIEKSKNFLSSVHLYENNRTNGKLIWGLDYTILINQDYNLMKQKYDELAKELNESLDKEFISNFGIGLYNDDQYRVISKIQYSLDHYGKISKPITPDTDKNIKLINILLIEHIRKKVKWYEVQIQFMGKLVYY